jgi:CNT family concentrative nucleoside transporter
MPPQLVSLLGLVTMVLLAWLMSSNRRRVPWRVVLGGLALQFALAVVILHTWPGRLFFDSVGYFFNNVLSFVESGSGFMFGVYGRPSDPPLPPPVTLLRTFAFGVLPTVIFFSSLMSVLYWLGIVQWVVKLAAFIMQWTLGTSGAESLSAAANVFVGHTEAPLVIKPFLATLTRSELNAVMVGGFATISGGLMAAFVGMGIDAGHLMTASVISAPAALLIAKLLEPETGTPQTLGTVKIQIERQGVNVIEAAAIGATDGLKLALNVGAMLIAFLALLAMLDGIIGWTGDTLAFIGAKLGWVASDYQPDWSLAAALAYLFAPLAWLMGIEWNECLPAGELLGLKMAANEFVAYAQLGEWLKPDSRVELSPRTQHILTYALCGFSNFGAIGIQIGGIGGLVPERRSDLAQLGLRAMLGGTLACCMTACVAGVLM